MAQGGKRGGAGTRNELTRKQQMFVLEYLKDLNATQAAIRAGYSLRTARQTGSENLSKLDIAAAITAAQRERTAGLEITADRVLQQIAQLAFFDPRELFDAQGRLKPIHQLTADQAAAIQSFEVVHREPCKRCPKLEAEIVYARKMAKLAFLILQQAKVMLEGLGLKLPDVRIPENTDRSNETKAAA